MMYIGEQHCSSNIPSVYASHQSQMNVMVHNVHTEYVSDFAILIPLQAAWPNHCFLVIPMKPYSSSHSTTHAKRSHDVYLRSARFLQYHLCVCFRFITNECFASQCTHCAPLCPLKHSLKHCWNTWFNPCLRHKWWMNSNAFNQVWIILQACVGDQSNVWLDAHDRADDDWLFHMCFSTLSLNNIYN